MEPEIIAALGAAAGVTLGAVIAATAKALKSTKRGSRPPPADLSPKVVIALRHIDELRAFAQDESIERVHQAESRRVILTIANALEALVLGMDRDRVEVRAAFRDAKEEREKHADFAQRDRDKLAGTLREIADLIQKQR